LPAHDEMLLASGLDVPQKVLVRPNL
jgi:hypothetical protein